MSNKYDPFDLSEGDEDYLPEPQDEQVCLAKRRLPAAVRPQTREILRDMDKLDIDTIRTRISVVQSEKSMDWADGAGAGKCRLEVTEPSTSNCLICMAEAVKVTKMFWQYVGGEVVK